MSLLLLFPMPLTLFHPVNIHAFFKGKLKECPPCLSVPDRVNCPPGAA
jgi:hypothetical protein